MASLSDCSEKERKARDSEGEREIKEEKGKDIYPRVVPCIIWVSVTRSIRMDTSEWKLTLL